jgi:hypothetical protein
MNISILSTFLNINVLNLRPIMDLGLTGGFAFRLFKIVLIHILYKIIQVGDLIYLGFKPRPHFSK